MPTIVSIQQGGTAATTATNARLNLGAVANTGDTVTGELKLLGSGTALNVANIGYFSGNVGVGVTNPSLKLHVSGSIYVTSGYGSIIASNPSTLTLGGSSSSPNAASIIWGDGSGWKLHFGCADGVISNVFAPKVTFIDSGSVGIGTTSPAERLHVVGNVVATGSITASYSDERLKDIVKPISNALENLYQIKTIYFKANDLVKSLTPHVDDKIQLGVTAQSVKLVYPEIVIPSAIDGNYDTVQYERLVPVLIAAILELDKKVKQLESELKP